MTVLHALDAVVARPRRAVEQVLADARGRLARLSAAEAFAAQQSGALIVDIRPALNREMEGLIPGALVVHRNVLEWRLDPASDARIPGASYDLQVIVMCNEGYTSSLAAACLLDIGVHRATDLIGGFRAWRAVGLPVDTGLGGRDARVEDAGQPADHLPAADPTGRLAGRRAPDRQGRGVLHRRRSGARPAGREIA